MFLPVDEVFGRITFASILIDLFKRLLAVISKYLFKKFKHFSKIFIQLNTKLNVLSLQLSE